MPDVQETPELTEAELLAINIDAYKRQATMNRINVSEAIKDLMEYIETGQESDHFVNPSRLPAKDNPWIEKKGCTIL